MTLSMLRCCLGFWILVFASIASASAQKPQQPPPPPAIATNIQGYNYVGCFNETTGDPTTGNARALGGTSPKDASDTMTVETCASTCGDDRYAGLEYGRECWCSSNLNSFSQKLADDNCTLACSGNAAENCGGQLTITLYERTAAAKSSGVSVTAHRGTGVYAVLIGLLAVRLVP